METAFEEEKSDKKRKNDVGMCEEEAHPTVRRRHPWERRSPHIMHDTVRDDRLELRVTFQGEENAQKVKVRKSKKAGFWIYEPFTGRCAESVFGDILGIFRHLLISMTILTFFHATIFL